MNIGIGEFVGKRYICGVWIPDVHTWEDQKPHIERLNDKLTQLNALRPLPASAIHKIKESLSIEWTYNSNSIEGNTLTLRETQIIIQEGLTVGGKTLREHFEAVNHEKAIHYLYSLVADDYLLRGIDILSLHELIMKNIDDDFAGRIRNGAVRITGANFNPPAPAKVSELLDELIDFVNNNPLNLNDVEMAAVFHHRLVWIHPFFDGNGRTARLAMNLLLMRNGYPPAIILKNDRKKYYDALNKANNGDYNKLVLMVIQALERSLNIYLNATPSYKEYQEISLLAEEPGIPYGAEYISLLARTGKIDAHKEGKNWMTTKSALEKYLSGKRKHRTV